YRLLRHLPAAIGIVLIVAVAGLAYRYRDLLKKPVQLRRQVQQVSLLPPQPPPPQPVTPTPPPAPKEDPVPPPEPEPEPEPAPSEQQPPQETLGLDSEGAAGGDAFGLVGRKGGRGLIGGGGGGNAMIWYGQQAGRLLEAELRRLLVGSPAQSSAYTVTVEVWISSDGRLIRAELNSGSGTAEVDQALRAALPKLRLAMDRPPPESLPQPLRLKLSSGIR
ncbi:MAG: energy transducer TonB, partial [Methylococcaceae bacterium]|nr:energy transducer TonB [Methylococcaceae bacterium]